MGPDLLRILLIYFLGRKSQRPGPSYLTFSPDFLARPDQEISLLLPLLAIAGIVPSSSSPVTCPLSGGSRIALAWFQLFNLLVGAFDAFFFES
jgi:hypothetical protein